LQALLNADITITLQWQDHSENETSFVIERSINGSAYREAARLPSGSTSYVDPYFKFPHPEINVSYRVTAAIDDIYSTYSNEALIVVPLITGLEDPLHNITLYPNPAKDMFRISCSSPIDEIKIFDAKGVMVYHSFTQTVANEIEIMTANFQNGIFLVLARRGDKTSTRKMMISK
jgi:hypothetical protein